LYTQNGNVLKVPMKSQLKKKAAETVRMISHLSRLTEVALGL